MDSPKPLRNHLRKYNAASFLQALWELSAHIEFRHPLPVHLETANPNGRKVGVELGFFLWELDTLAREAILYCEPKGGASVTGWMDLRTALQKLRSAEESAAEIGVHNVLSELSRITHRQFHWQQGITHAHLARTVRIFRSAGMNDVVRDVYGLSTENVAIAGFAALASFTTHHAITPDWPENCAERLGFNPRPVIEHLTTDLLSLRDRAFAERQLNENWAYAFNPLWLHPLVQIPGSDNIRCPIPGLLIRRLTEGLYFDVVGKSVDILSAKMGPAFQAYVGEVLERSNKGSFSVLSERSYGTKKKPKDTTDWLVSDKTGSLFVEVKILKMGRVMKEQLSQSDEVLRQMKKLAKAIGQLYATLEDALIGQYPHWQPANAPVYPIIVTLENWNLFTHHWNSILSELVVSELKRRGIDPSVITRHQFVVCSIEELQAGIQIMAKTGIKPFMDPITSGSKIGWLFGGYIQSEFQQEAQSIENLFPEDRLLLLPKELRDRV